MRLLRQALRIRYDQKFTKFGMQKMWVSQYEILNELFSVRNNLVHYKLSDTAAGYEAQPPRGGKVPDGVVVVDFSAPLTKVKPAFVEKLTGNTAVECFNTAFEVLDSWGKMEGLENATGLEKIT